jgi:hypothetical protein
MKHIFGLLLMCCITATLTNTDENINTHENLKARMRDYPSLTATPTTTLDQNIMEEKRVESPILGYVLAAFMGFALITIVLSAVVYYIRRLHYNEPADEESDPIATEETMLQTYSRDHILHIVNAQA